MLCPNMQANSFSAISTLRKKLQQGKGESTKYSSPNRVGLA